MYVPLVKAVRDDIFPRYETTDKQGSRGILGWNLINNTIKTVENLCGVDDDIFSSYETMAEPSSEGILGGNSTTNTIFTSSKFL